MNPVEVTRGDGPVVLAFPHASTHLPDDIRDRLNESGRALADTDWHVDRLYDGLLPGATRVRANFHRYVIDANRDPGGQSLYPGQNTTGLVPETDFDGRPIWTDDVGPTDDDIATRLRDFHAPYHAALRAELDRVRAEHGVVVLYDCHSIRSHIPFLFDGVLPDFNIGTVDGASCNPALRDAVVQICDAAEGYRGVMNGRFKGGWTTRHYSDAGAGRHTIQMELAQSAYLTAETPPWEYSPQKADRLRPHLARILETLADRALSLEA